MLAGETAGGMVECYPCPTSGHVRLYVALEGSRGRIRLARKMKGGSSVALIGFLILFPLLVAGVLLLVGNETARRVIVCSSAVIIGFGSVWLVLANLGTPWVGIEFSSGAIDIVCTLIGLVIAAVILCFGVKYKNVLACVLAVVQVVGSLVFERVRRPWHRSAIWVVPG